MNTHRSGIRGTVRNSVTGALIEGASLMLQGKRKTKKATADDDGAFEITKFLAGKARLIITAPGYNSQTIAVKIIRGKIIELSIELQSQVIALTATA